MNPSKKAENNGNESLARQEKISRDELERMSSELIRILHRRTTAHRFKPSQHDGPRLAYARATITAVQAYTALLRDSEIEELEKRIAELEKARLRK